MTEPANLDSARFSQQVGLTDSHAQQKEGIDAQGRTVKHIKFSDKDLAKLSDCAGNIFNDQEDYRAMNLYGKMQIKNDFSLPNPAQLLRNLKTMHLSYRAGLRTICLYLVAAELGHEWGLKGTMICDGEPADLEGGSSIYMQSRASMRLREYFQKHPAQSSAPTTPLAAFEESERARLVRAMEKGAKFSKQGDSRSDRAEKALEELQENKMVVIPTGWHKHTIDVVLYRDKKGNNYLAYINRGERSRGETLEKATSDMKIFLIGKELEKNDIRNLMESWNTSSEERKEEQMQYFEGSGPESMRVQLKLQDVATVPRKNQKVGNCSWANTKCGVHAALVMILMDKQLDSGENKRGPASPEEIKEAIAAVQSNAQKIYKGWTTELRREGLQSFLELQKSIQRGELNIQPREFGALFRNQDLFHVAAQICSKLADSNRFTPNDPSTAELEREMTAFIATLDLPLKECPIAEQDRRLPLIPGRERDQLAFQREAILKSVPGAFNLYRSEDGKLRAAYAKPNGEIVNEEVNGDEKLISFMQNRSLKYPVNVTKELFDRTFKKERLREIRLKESEAIKLGILFDNEDKAKHALLEKPPGSCVFAVGKGVGEYMRITLLPGKKFGIEHTTTFSPGEAKHSDLKVLQEHKKFISYSPSLPVWKGRVKPEVELETERKKWHEALKEEGDYLCVKTAIPVDFNDPESEFEDKLKLLVKKGGQVLEFELAPDKPLLEQIESLLKGE